jgi:type IV fimbrial biogenesis protein FimT
MDERIKTGRGAVGLKGPVKGRYSARSFGCSGHIKDTARSRRRTDQSGVTAVELAVALAIAALLATLAVPGFASLRRSVGVSSAANELLWALHLARSSARLHGQAVTVCLSRNEKTCLATPDAVAAGWLVFHPAGHAAGTQLIAAGPPLHSFHLPPGMTVTASRPAVTFWPVSRAGSTGTFELCDAQNRTPGRSIVVSQTGRPRVAAEAAQCAG